MQACDSFTRRVETVLRPALYCTVTVPLQPNPGVTWFFYLRSVGVRRVPSLARATI